MVKRSKHSKAAEKILDLKIIREDSKLMFGNKLINSAESLEDLIDEAIQLKADSPEKEVTIIPGKITFETYEIRKNKDDSDYVWV